MTDEIESIMQPRDDDNGMKHIVDGFKKAFIAGSVCSFVSANLNPLDVIKIRMQIQTVKYSGFVQSFGLIYKEEGFRGLARGMEASVLRDMTFSSIRIGAYEPVRNMIANLLGHDPKDTTPVVKYSSALFTGAIGAGLINPLDLIKTRFQAASATDPLPYPNTFTGIKHVYRTSGFSQGLYKGWEVTTIRAAILSSAQIGSYDTIKNNLLVNTFGFKEGFLLHVLSSMLAGIVTTTATNPADVIKTRYMSDKVGKYSSPFHCIVCTFREEGIRGFFKGWTPAYTRLGPHTMLSLMLIEKARAYAGLNAI